MRRARLAMLAALALGAACHAREVPRPPTLPAAGLTISLYAGYGVVDDRRWIDVAGGAVLLPNIDPGAELASLVIEPATRAIRIGACTREPMPAGATERFAPAVRCRVTAPPGRYLIRLLYVTKALGYQVRHDIAMRAPATAQLTSQFAIATPIWQARAEVVLYHGVPGGEHAPREVARGNVVLDGSTAVLAVPARSVPARLRRIYEGAVVTSPDSTDAAWGNDSVQAVWVWLELLAPRLAPGPIRVHLELPDEGIRDLDVTTSNQRPGDTMLRVPLWVDDALRGSRQRSIGYNDGASLTEHYIFGVANTGDVVREVFVEEPLRKATRRRLVRAWPRKPTFDANTLHSRLQIRPGQIERTGYTLTYDF